MPKSKRDRPIALTKVKRKDPARKEKLIEELRQATDKFQYVYLLDLDNQRNVYQKMVREKMKPGRVFCGKNKLMQVALGLTPETECQDNIHHIARRLRGERALLITDKRPDDIERFCADFRPEEFARSGFTATETIVLPEGTDALSKFPHSVEPHLRALGLPTLLKDGVIHLMGSYTVCREGQPLTPEQAQLLKQLGIKMARFEMYINSYWARQEGQFTAVVADDDQDSEEQDMDDDAAEGGEMDDD
ncbi:unnamed protein product [Vitrella brassicaformis CCMP3155]|uniref:Ribosome assembly factor mrt4 n=2 Tax=Vitrella brassicaformis TaxID=1169539 RepID=A0A0G4F1K6_VITBC|nr:unnamed protein product [Vitrella brassicaformis CCMP3155]|eukprot:CEM05472.1 unnamed protein product [Vitrella brassicaformis CCMP3155]